MDLRSMRLLGLMKVFKYRNCCKKKDFLRNPYFGGEFNPPKFAAELKFIKECWIPNFDFELVGGSFRTVVFKH